MKPAPTEGVKAKKIMIPSLMVTKGTIAQCNLQTAINTEVAGLIVCTLARDVRSTDGNVKLMKKGSLMVGEYQNGLEIGDKRIFVLWTRYEDKQTHVTMEIASPGADELGRAGLGGKINTKFWERFGAAIMFSLVGDIPSFLNKSGNGSSTTVNVINSTTTTGAEIIKNVISLTKNVRPSLEKNQGGMVSIVFARDLDFSSTYRLKKEGDR